MSITGPAAARNRHRDRGTAAPAEDQDNRADERYRWVALANMTASVFMSALDSDARVFNGKT